MNVSVIKKSFENLKWKFRNIKDDNVEDRIRIIEELAASLSALPEIEATSLEAEYLLRYIGDEIMSNNELDKKYSDVFCRSQVFMKCLLRIMQGYWIYHTDNYIPEISNSDNNCFVSHKSYEIGLHFLLSFLENKALIQSTYESLKGSMLNSYIYLLAKNLENDISYHTQEIAVDILCRLYMYLKRTDMESTEYLLSHVPESLSAALQDPTVGAIKIMHDMRAHIWNINTKNSNILSIPYAELSAMSCPNKKGSKPNGSQYNTRKLEKNSFVDLGLLSFVIDLPGQCGIANIPYTALKDCIFLSKPTPSFQFSMEALPESLVEMLSSTEIKAKCDTFMIRFNDEDSKKMCELKIRQRLREAEDYVADISDNDDDQVSNTKEPETRRLSLTTPLNLSLPSKQSLVTPAPVTSTSIANTTLPDESLEAVLVSSVMEANSSKALHSTENHSPTHESTKSGFITSPGSLHTRIVPNQVHVDKKINKNVNTNSRKPGKRQSEESVKQSKPTTAMNARGNKDNQNYEKTTNLHTGDDNSKKQKLVDNASTLKTENDIPKNEIKNNMQSKTLTKKAIQVDQTDKQSSPIQTEAVKNGQIDQKISKNNTKIVKSKTSTENHKSDTNKNEKDIAATKENNVNNNWNSQEIKGITENKQIKNTLTDITHTYGSKSNTQYVRTNIAINTATTSNNVRLRNKYDLPTDSYANNEENWIPESQENKVFAAPIDPVDRDNDEATVKTASTFKRPPSILAFKKPSVLPFPSGCVTTTKPLLPSHEVVNETNKDSVNNHHTRKFVSSSTPINVNATLSPIQEIPSSKNISENYKLSTTPFFDDDDDFDNNNDCNHDDNETISTKTTTKKKTSKIAIKKNVPVLKNTSKSKGTKPVTCNKSTTAANTKSNKLPTKQSSRIAKKIANSKTSKSKNNEESENDSSDNESTSQKLESVDCQSIKELKTSAKSHSRTSKNNVKKSPVKKEKKPLLSSSATEKSLNQTKLDKSVNRKSAYDFDNDDNDDEIESNDRDNDKFKTHNQIKNKNTNTLIDSQQASVTTVASSEDSFGFPTKGLKRDGNNVVIPFPIKPSSLTTTPTSTTHHHTTSKSSTTKLITKRPLKPVKSPKKLEKVIMPKYNPLITKTTVPGSLTVTSSDTKISADMCNTTKVTYHITRHTVPVRKEKKDKNSKIMLPKVSNTTNSSGNTICASLNNEFNYNNENDENKGINMNHDDDINCDENNNYDYDDFGNINSDHQEEVKPTSLANNIKASSKYDIVTNSMVPSNMNNKLDYAIKLFEKNSMATKTIQKSFGTTNNADNLLRNASTSILPSATTIATEKPMSVCRYDKQSFFTSNSIKKSSTGTSLLPVKPSSKPFATHLKPLVSSVVAQHSTNATIIKTVDTHASKNNTILEDMRSTMSHTLSQNQDDAEYNSEDNDRADKENNFYNNQSDYSPLKQQHKRVDNQDKAIVKRNRVSANHYSHDSTHQSPDDTISTTDATDTFQIILEELQSMQKNKEDRKKHKLMMKAVQLAKSQILEFLESWDVKIKVNSNDFINNFTQQVDETIETYKIPVLNPFEEDYQLFITDHHEINESLQILQQEIDNFNNESNKMMKSLKEIENGLKNEIGEIKKNIVSYFQSEIMGHESVHGYMSSSVVCTSSNRNIGTNNGGSKRSKQAHYYR